MIVLNLSCAKQHRFEGWFASGAEFERQLAAAGVACPICGDKEIARLPSNPHVMKPTTRPERAAVGKAAGDAADGSDGLRSMLSLMQRVLGESEDVGEAFPEEARRIHYQEAPARSIRGLATRADAAELIDEGIQVVTLSLPPTGKMH